MKIVTTPQLGFTLIEMAMVLFIVGLLMSGLLVPISAQFDRQNIQRTTQLLETTREALIGYVVANGYFPCPANPSPTPGNEGIPDSSLCDDEGILPWRVLSVKGEDSWKKAFRYRVHEDFDEDSNPANDLLTVKKIRELISNDITVTVEGVDLQQSVVAVVFSSGKNQQRDGENGDNDNTYLVGDYVAGSFDDQLIWLSKNRLAYRLALGE